MNQIAPTPKPPYYAVIFSNHLNQNSEGYARTALEMEALARQQSGFLGFESARESLGISVSYWQNLASIKQWEANAEHKGLEVFFCQTLRKGYKQNMLISCACS